MAHPGQRPRASKEMLDTAQASLDRLRTKFVTDALHATEFGWAPFEKIWGSVKGSSAIVQLEPLRMDWTEPLVDDHGRVIGLRNAPPKTTPVNLGESKFVVYSYDGEADDP